MSEENGPTRFCRDWTERSTPLATLERAFGVVRPGAMVVSVGGLPEPETASRT